MTSLLTNNPYRILGVYSNSPKKDVLSNLNKMKAFLKVGKAVSFPLDMPQFLSSIERDEAIVSSVQTSIELPMDQIRHSLFWFMKATPLNTSDMQYQMIADKLATTIFQCGINYYNDSEDDDAAHKAMILQEYAFGIAVGQMAKSRCQENYNILKNTILNLPPKEVLAEAKDITKEVEKFCKLPDKIEHSQTLLNNTRQYLCSIKTKLGASNSFYLKLSTQVVGNALHNVIEEVNLAQKYDPAEERRKKA